MLPFLERKLRVATSLLPASDRGELLLLLLSLSSFSSSLWRVCVHSGRAELVHFGWRAGELSGGVARESRLDTRSSQLAARNSSEPARLEQRSLALPEQSARCVVACRQCRPIASPTGMPAGRPVECELAVSDRERSARRARVGSSAQQESAVNSTCGHN